MPVIEPTTFDESVEFIQLHRDDIKRGIYDVKIQAAWVSRLAPIDLKLLADYCESTKSLIACHTNMEQLLVSFANEQKPPIRAEVARNVNTPSKVLERLSKDSVEYVRSAVARNPKTPESVLRILALEPSEAIRKAVADNEAAPIDLLMRLPNIRWCDLCSHLCERNDVWDYGNNRCAICARYYCKRHGQEIWHGGGDYDTLMWRRCVAHLKLRNKLGRHEWNSLYAIFFHGKPDQTLG